jgi:hypothetical protein
MQNNDKILNLCRDTYDTYIYSTLLIIIKAIIIILTNSLLKYALSLMERFLKYSSSIAKEKANTINAFIALFINTILINFLVINKPF